MLVRRSKQVVLHPLYKEVLIFRKVMRAKAKHYHSLVVSVPSRSGKSPCRGTGPPNLTRSHGPRSSGLEKYLVFVPLRVPRQVATVDMNMYPPAGNSLLHTLRDTRVVHALRLKQSLFLVLSERLGHQTSSVPQSLRSPSRDAASCLECP